MRAEELFKLCSDPTRLRILVLLQAEGERCVCELTHALELSQPKVSRHLALMRRAGMVVARRSGKWMHYSINEQMPPWMRSVLRGAGKGLRDMDEHQRDLRRIGELPRPPASGLCR